MTGRISHRLPHTTAARPPHLTARFDRFDLTAQFDCSTGAGRHAVNGRPSRLTRHAPRLTTRTTRNSTRPTDPQRGAPPPQSITGPADSAGPGRISTAGAAPAGHTRRGAVGERAGRGGEEGTSTLEREMRMFSRSRFASGRYTCRRRRGRSQWRVTTIAAGAGGIGRGGQAMAASRALADASRWA